MDRELKEQWITALRSGKYKQTRELLRENNFRDIKKNYGYCCLGVLADICPLTNELDGWKKDGTLPISNKKTLGTWNEQDFSSGELPKWIADELGLNDEQLKELMELNDGKPVSTQMKIIAKNRETEIFEGGTFRKGYTPWSFEQIAAWIEKNL